MSISFGEFAQKAGISPYSSFAEIYDCAVDHYELKTLPFDTADDDWWSRAEAYADRVASNYAI
jgi:hypothetical protein